MIASKVSLLVLLLLSVVSCAKKEETTLTTDSTQTASTADTSATPGSVVTVIPAEGGPAFPDAKLLIVSPREGQVFANAGDSVRVVMNVTGMQIAKPTEGDSTRGIAYSKEGQHVHVIIDDKPYMANYKNGQPFNVGVLAAGRHTLRAFPSRSWHESVKTPVAFQSRVFYVGEGPAKGMKDSLANELNGPLLTYSRPKGVYKGADAKKVLLDFYVTNAKIGETEHKVRVSVDGNAISTLTKWAAHYIQGLTPGKHMIKLELLDQKGNVVPGRYNSAQQEITVE